MAWPRWCTGISRLEFAFVLVAISTGCVSLLFNTFHVTLFRSVYGLDPAAFAAGHAVYAVWNTANDLGSGWVADMLAARNGSRVPLVRVGGLLWVTVGFLFPWWRWAFLPLPVQFVLALSLFDGFYSFVAIIEGALLAELVNDTPARARIGRINSLASLCVFPLISRAGFAYWNPADLAPFRVFVCGVAIFACAGVALGTRLMLQVCPTTLTALAAAAHHAPGMITTEKASSGSHSHAQYGAVSAPGRGGGSISVNSMQQAASLQGTLKGSKSKALSLSQFARDVLGHRNFLRFVAMDSILEAENIFQNQFRQTFVECLLASWSVAERAWLISAIPTASRLLRVGMYSLVERYGVHCIYHGSFALKLILGVLACILGAHSTYLPMSLFICLSSCLVAAPLGLFGVTISELVDEHRTYVIKAGRKDEPSVAGMYQSTHALFAKPCNSIGPVIAVLVLGPTSIETSRASGGAHDHGAHAHSHGAHPSDSLAAAPSSHSDAAGIHHASNLAASSFAACFWLVSLTPVITALIQGAIWDGYTLRGAKLFAMQGGVPSGGRGKPGHAAL